MRSRLRFCCVMLALAATLPAASEEPLSFADDAALAPLPERWAELLDLFDVPGAAVAVTREGKTYVETFGFRDPTKKLPVTADTLFYIASVTKTYNAVAVGTLVDQGRLSLDDRVVDILPRFELSDPDLTQRVTVRDLLSHRYGITSGPIVLLDAYSGEITDDRYYHWLSNAEIEGTPAYSNLHYTLVGRVIESLTGMDWRDYLRKEVLLPAALDRTTGYASILYSDTDVAIPVERVDGEWQVVELRKSDRTMHAAGGLGTSTRDAARYLELHLQNGRLGGRQIVSPSYMREMRTIQAGLAEAEGSIRVIEGFGLAWQVGTYVGSTPLCVHSGTYAGASAWFALLPDEDAGIAIMINGGGAARGWADIVAVDLLEALTGRAPPWSPYERYPDMQRQRKAEAAKSNSNTAGPANPGLLAASFLSRPIDLYTGWFHHPDLGTLVVERHDGGLAITLGDLPLDATPGEEHDHFIIEGAFEPAPTCRFVVNAHGTVEEIVVDEVDLGPLSFRR